MRDGTALQASFPFCCIQVTLQHRHVQRDSGLQLFGVYNKLRVTKLVCCVQTSHMMALPIVFVIASLLICVCKHCRILYQETAKP